MKVFILALLSYVAAQNTTAIVPPAKPDCNNKTSTSSGKGKATAKNDRKEILDTLNSNTNTKEQLNVNK